jgi:hypothetical protein
MEHKALLSEMFIQCGYQELLFVRNNGATLGFLFGILQMVVWFVWHPTIEAPLQASVQALVIFPVFGLVVGALTNWLSLLAIFSPVEPIELCGWCHPDLDGDYAREAPPHMGDDDKDAHLTRPSPTVGAGGGCCAGLGRRSCVLHGLFLRRQREVSAVYARLVGTQVLAMPALMAAVMEGSTVPGGPARLHELMAKHFGNAFDAALDAFPTALQSVGLNAANLLGADDLAAMRADAVECLLEALPRAMALPAVLRYFEGAIGIEVTLRERMAKLPHAEFESILHPVFQEDEWKLVLVGGMLGVVLGFVQAYFIN